MDPNRIRLTLKNDGRMLISKIKEHIHNEEMVLDEFLFLGILHPSLHDRVKRIR